MLESLVTTVSQFTSPQKLLWIVAVMGLFWLLEGYYAFAKTPYSRLGHARTNLVLLGFVVLINLGFGLATAGVFVWLDQGNFGLLSWLTLPLWAELLISLVVLDLLAQYIAHVLLHKVPSLWRLHIVHHSDTNVDVTTGTRHHPLDFIFREVMALLAVVLLGMPLAFYLFYRVITIFFTYWTHANIKLPSKVDTALGFLFVTPQMHKVHHHHTLPHTDMNFGNMLSVWDRLFGTYGTIAAEDLVYGVDVADYRRSEDLGYQLGVPWNKEVGPGLGVLRPRKTEPFGLSESPK